MVSADEVWAGFTADPREPGVADVRATDADREVGNDVLRDAYADGRLTRAEYDERSDAVLATRHLGGFVPLLSDLIPALPATRRSAVTDLHGAAVQKYERELRNARNGWASVSFITVGIWVATSLAGAEAYFFWPIFPILGTGIGWVSMRLNRQDRIESIEEKLGEV